MPHPHGYALLCTVLLLLAGCAEPAGPDADTPAGSEVLFSDESGAIEGVVTDDALSPIAGATVTILETLETALTQEGGKFQFSNLAPGTVSIAVEAPGFQAAGKEVDV